MRYFLAVLVLAPVVLLVVSAIRGRVQVRSCCAVDAASDGRISDAYREPAAGRSSQIG
jgi:hypothetical protein